MNHLSRLKRLSNHYWVMRHGQSLANLGNLIVSHPQNGVNDYGLSTEGEAQVNRAAQQALEFDSTVMIVSSDFKRARESAEIVHRLLRCDTPLGFDSRLRERNFGDLELSADSDYAGVWAQDQVDADNRFRAVESPNQVMDRVSKLVLEYEASYSGAKLLLVSHGDALQILQTAFAGHDASRHRSQAHLETAEIRRLTLTGR